MNSNGIREVARSDPAKDHSTEGPDPHRIRPDASNEKLTRRRDRCRALSVLRPFSAGLLDPVDLVKNGGRAIEFGGEMEAEDLGDERIHVHVFKRG